MKDPLNRTKVVLRHLPPSISELALMEQIDGRFSGRYKWFSFRPGKHRDHPPIGNYAEERGVLQIATAILPSEYVLKDSSKTRSNGKDKSTYMLVSRKEEQQAASATEESEEGTVTGLNGTITIASGSVEIGKRRVMLLKGKEREASHVSGGSSQQLNATASVRNLTGSTSSKQSPRHKATGRTIRSILSNKDMLQSQSYLGGIQSEQQTQEVNYVREKRPPRPPNSCLIMKDTSIATPSSVPYGDKKKSLNDKAAVNNLFGSVSTGDNKNEKCMRNKDRPDRGVWTPRHSDGVHATDDNHISAQQLSDSLDGISMSQLTVGHKDGDADMGFVSADGGCGSNSIHSWQPAV